MGVSGVVLGGCRYQAHAPFHRGHPLQPPLPPPGVRLVDGGVRLVSAGLTLSPHDDPPIDKAEVFCLLR